MIRIISPVNESENNIGAVAFVCENISKSIKEAVPGSVSYSFFSKNKIVQLFKNILLLLCSYAWLLNGDSVVFIYPTIPLYPATSTIKYYISSMFYKLMYAIKKISKGSMVLVIIDLPKEQEESFNTNKIKITYDRFLKFENGLIKAASKIIYFSAGFKHLLEKRNLGLTSKSAVCSIGYTKHQPPQNTKNQNTTIFYSGELSRDYEKSKLMEICNCITGNERLIICGKNGEWLNELNNPKVCYKGFVDFKTHDEIASKCDFGLVMYPDTGYYKYVTPSKLNAYISLSIPVLAISNMTLKTIFDAHDIGQCVKEQDFVLTFKKWCDEKIYLRYKKLYTETDYHMFFLKTIKDVFND